MVNRRIINNGKTHESGYFNESDEISKRNTFSKREVGLTHPDTSSFIRLTDRGDIEIFAGEELGIIISPSSGSISIFADVLKIYSKEDDGLRWNNMSLNYASDQYSEPALVKTNKKNINSGFNYADYYLNSLDDFDGLESDNNIVTIQGEYAFRDSGPNTGSLSSHQNKSNISPENMDLLKEYALTNNQNKIDYIKNLLEYGYNFDQAREKTTRDKGV
jgi:hypothetical protein